MINYKRAAIYLIIALAIILAIAYYTFQNDGTDANTASFEQVTEITIGYFPNLTHAPAIAGIAQGIFADEMDGVKIKTRIFPNGSLLMNALSTGQIGVGYVGPGPAINRYLQGARVKALAGVSTGGTVLVTRRGVGYNNPVDLAGKVVATAALGCTHDLLFRKILQENGLAVSGRGGEVEHRAQKPATMMGLFLQGQLDAAMVSEPWASRMVEEIGAKVVMEWNQVPWKGKMPATILVTGEQFAADHQQLLSSFVRAHSKAVQFVNNNPEETAEIVQREITRLTKQELSLSVIESSLARTRFAVELDQQVLQELADLSAELGFIDTKHDLSSFIDNSHLEGVR